jgi:hypothetical protein
MKRKEEEDGLCPIFFFHPLESFAPPNPLKFYFSFLFTPVKSFK